MDLSQYLSELEGRYRLFDVGRRIRKLDKQQFAQFEQGLIPYPAPYLQHAWLALYITHPKQIENETLMFLKWPLDEQGKLIPYVRDDLVKRLIALSETPLQADTEIEDPLKDNPFSFNPDDVRMANLHALIQQQAHRKPSTHYANVKHYLQAGTANPDALEQWQNLGLQGIADVSARLDENKISLNACITHMPQEVLLAFAQCLEHHTPPLDVCETAKQRLQTDLNQTDNTIAVEAGLRIVGACQNDALRLSAWQNWLDSPYAKNVACVLAFATRNYEDLAFMPERIEEFLVNLAQLNENEDGSYDFTSFVKIVSDLLYLPGTRNLLLNTLRSEKRPDILGLAMQALLQSKQ